MGNGRKKREQQGRQHRKTSGETPRKPSPSPRSSATTLKLNKQKKKKSKTKKKKTSTSKVQAQREAVRGLKRRILRKQAKLARMFSVLKPKGEPELADEEGLAWLFSKFGCDDVTVQAALALLRGSAFIMGGAINW